MVATVFTANPALNQDDANPGATFRVVCTLTAASNGSLQVSFQPGTTGALYANHASIGKWSGSGSGTTGAPLELKFAGASGFSNATTTQVSDLLDHSVATNGANGFALSSSDKVVVIYDTQSGTANAVASQRYNNAATNADTYFKVGTSYNVQAPTGLTLLSAINYSVSKVETNSAAGFVGGASGAGSVGTLRGNVAKAVAGVVATGSAGSVSFSTPGSGSPMGVVGAGSAGVLALAESKIPLGVSANGSAGSLSENSSPSPAVTGVAGIGTAGVLGKALGDVPLGVSATGSAGTLSETGSASPALLGVSATGSAGSVTETISASPVLAGVSATGSAGVLSFTGQTVVNVNGVSAAGSAGSLSDLVAKTIGAVSATGSAGTVSFTGQINATITGVLGAGSAGILSVSSSASRSIAGVAAAGAAGSAMPLDAKTLAGAAGQGFAGSILGAFAVPAVGVHGDGAAGSLGVSRNATANIAGAFGTGHVGTLSFHISNDGDKSLVCASIDMYAAVYVSISFGPTVDGDTSNINAVNAVAISSRESVSGLLETKDC